jgi:hypothetical protein
MGPSGLCNLRGKRAAVDVNRVGTVQQSQGMLYQDIHRYVQILR